MWLGARKPNDPKFELVATEGPSASYRQAAKLDRAS
jgi:hypothetical protein